MDVGPALAPKNMSRVTGRESVGLWSCDAFGKLGLAGTWKDEHFATSLQRCCQQSCPLVLECGLPDSSVPGDKSWLPSALDWFGGKGFCTLSPRRTSHFGPHATASIICSFDFWHFFRSSREPTSRITRVLAIRRESYTTVKLS